MLWKVMLVSLVFLMLISCGDKESTPTPVPMSTATLSLFDQLKLHAPTGKVRSLQYGSFGRVYAGTSSGLYIFEQGIWRYDDVTNKFGLVNAIDELNAGVLYIGTDAENNPDKQGGLWELKNGEWNNIFPHTVFSFGMRQGYLVAATWNGLWQLDESGNWSVLYDSQILHYTGHIHSYAEVNTGKAIFDCLGTIDSGIICVNQRSSHESYVLNSSGEYVNKLTNDNIRIMRLDRDTSRSMYWIGSDGGGIDLLSYRAMAIDELPRKENWESATLFPYKPSLIGGYHPNIGYSVMDIRFDRYERPWLSTLDSGTLYLPFGNTWTVIDPTASNVILFAENLVLVGTNDGLKVFDLPPR